MLKTILGQSNIFLKNTELHDMVVYTNVNREKIDKITIVSTNIMIIISIITTDSHKHNR